MKPSNNIEQKDRKQLINRRTVLMGSSFLMGFAMSSAIDSSIYAQSTSKPDKKAESFIKGKIENRQQIKQKRTSGFYHVGLFAADLDATVRFYTEAFGLIRRYSWTQTKSIEQTSTGEFFKFPFRIEFLDFGDGSYLEVFDLGKPPNELVGDYRLPINHFALRVSDIDDSYARAISAGAKPYNFNIDDKKWDGQPLSFTINGNPPITLRIAFVLGPNNEIIEIATLPDNSIL